MRKKISKELKSELLFLGVTFGLISVLILTNIIFYYRTHPDFDEKISGKEAIVVSEVATIYYDEPLGRNTGTVTKSQKVILTGKMAHFLQINEPMMEVYLENNKNTLVWICKRHITISD